MPLSGVNGITELTHTKRRARRLLNTLDAQQHLDYLCGHLIEYAVAGSVSGAFTLRIAAVSVAELRTVWVWRVHLL